MAALRLLHLPERHIPVLLDVVVIDAWVSRGRALSSCREGCEGRERCEDWERARQREDGLRWEGDGGGREGGGDGSRRRRLSRRRGLAAARRRERVSLAGQVEEEVEAPKHQVKRALCQEKGEHADGQEESEDDGDQGETRTGCRPQENDLADHLRDSEPGRGHGTACDCPAAVCGARDPGERPEVDLRDPLALDAVR